MRFAQCVFLVGQVQICQSPDFVISMSDNPSSNCSRHLRRLVVSYKGEISLRFDPPSQYSRRVRSLLLRKIIRIRTCGLSSYSQIRRTTVGLLTVLASQVSKKKQLSLSRLKFDPRSIGTFILNGSTQVHLINFRYTRSIRKPHTRAQQHLQTIISQLLGVGRDVKQSSVAPQRSA